MNWKPAFALVLLGVTLITCWGGQIFDNEEFRVEGEKLKDKSLRRRRLVWCFTLLALLPLLVFKYYNFLNNSLTDGLAAIGLQFSLPGLNWAVPVGISFFTFQAVGYMLDVYHGRIRAENSILDYLLFCSFFPQTASGPISKYSELMPQIKSPHHFNSEQCVAGLKVLLWGMFMKVVVADRVGIYVNTIYSDYEMFSGSTCLVASFFYTVQIYADFAGYSLMAVGIGKCLGFDLINNFNRPYFADSITNFWKRWHISLTRWLTTYVYIPLGGSRCSKLRQYWNILATFLVSGLWHGANWTFVVWGTIHGFLQILEKALGLDPKGKFAESLWLKRIKPIRIIVTFLLVNLAWIFFRMPTIGAATSVVYKILTDMTSPLYFNLETNTIHAVAVVALLFVKELTEELFPQFSLINHGNIVVRWTTYLLLTISLVFFGVLDSGQFIYVNF